MDSVPFGRTGRTTTRIGFGAWAIGGTWGEVSLEDAKAALHAALDAGMTFIDTADVYGDGRSERIIREVLAERGGARPFVATKAGRRLTPHVAEAYTGAALEGVHRPVADQPGRGVPGPRATALPADAGLFRSCGLCRA